MRSYTFFSNWEPVGRILVVDKVASMGEVEAIVLESDGNFSVITEQTARERSTYVVGIESADDR